MNKKQIISLLTGFFLFCLLNVVPAAPVIWNGNGHYYDVVEDASNMSWEEAKNWASELSYTDASGQLFKGYLATITSSPEANFIASLTFTKTTYLLGGYQTPTTDETTLAEMKADWYWVTGEAWDFTDWRPSEPNNFFRWVGVTGAGRVENYLQYFPLSSDKGWNDVYTGTFTDNEGEHFFGSRNFIVEYEAATSKDPLIVTVEGKNVNLDWSAMPEAQSSTLYVALSHYNGDLDINTLWSGNMGKTTSLYAPDLPSGLIIYSAVIAHTSQKNVFSNIIKFMPFSGVVTFPESGNELITINDTGGVGNFSIKGTRNTDGSIASISQISGDNGSGVYALNISNDKPVSYVKGGETVNFNYHNDDSVSFTAKTSRSVLNRSNDVIDCSLSREQYSKTLYHSGVIFTDTLFDEAKKQGFPVEMYKSFYEHLKKILEDNGSNDGLEGIAEFAHSKLAAYLTLLHISLEGVVDGMLQKYDTECNNPSSSPTNTDSSGQAITLDTTCPIPAGATYFESANLQYYELNGHEVGPRYQWLKNSDGSYYLSIEFCRNEAGQKNGWFIQYQSNGLMRSAYYFNNGNLGNEYQFYSDGGVWVEIIRKNGEIVTSSVYNEDGSISQFCDQSGCTNY
ncbi:MAG: hypothetical protein QM504_02535 [Pseudomonadota bacterium]